jgi:hypothetical protein
MDWYRDELQLFVLLPAQLERLLLARSKMKAERIMPP